jgi:putative membrane protein
MFYDTSYYGMHFVWWLIWMGLLFWIFAIPYDIPGQKLKRESPLDLLRKRYVMGEITADEYDQKKKFLEGN